VNTIDDDFILDDSQLFVYLGDVDFDLANFSVAGKVSFQVLDRLLKNLIILIIDGVSNVEVDGVHTNVTKTIFASIDGGHLQDTTEVLELTRAEFQMVLKALDDGGSSGRQFLDLDSGQSWNARIGKA